jgi:uncharacterized protein (TIGR00730 family)
MNICVFCSGRDLDEKYVEPAKELAKLLAQNGHNLVWGGSDDGLMEIMASGVQEGGGKIYGISVELLKNHARKDVDEMIITKDFSERKALMLSRSDAIVVLVGGTGTLDEASEIIENKKHKAHNKPIIILNTAGFYDGLSTLLKRMEAENFLPGPLKELVDFAETPSEVIRLLQEHAK